MNVFASLSRRAQAMLLALIVIAGAGLFWGRGFIGLADGQIFHHPIFGDLIDDDDRQRHGGEKQGTFFNQ